MEVNKPRHQAAGQVDPFIIRSFRAGGDDGLDPSPFTRILGGQGCMVSVPSAGCR